MVEYRRLAPALALLLVTACGVIFIAVSSSSSSSADTQNFSRNSRKVSQPPTKDAITDFILNNLEPDNIREHLRYLTQQPHLGGTRAELLTAEWTAELWRQQGLDDVSLVPYDVMLSYPDSVLPNMVRLLDSGSEAVLWESDPRQKPLYAPEEQRDDVPFNFNGYSAPGTVKGDLVYVHYGRGEDFDYLEQAGVNITGRIVLARYGEIFRANIAEFAEQRGALGLILFSDPADYATRGPDAVYPDTVMMPPSAAPLGTVKLMDGDPLTPYYPAIESAFHIPVDEAAIPKIPVQPISYDNAWTLLNSLGGPAGPAEWQGGLNITYNLGPSSALQTVELEVHTSNVQTTVYNVVGVIRGSEEPDRYVLLGNHRDAWIFGAIDPSSGSAAMMELSRVLMQLRNETGWRPRRSLVFLSWGAEEYGLVGSMEWTEQFGKQLQDRAVAYLNVDMSIEGNYTLRTKSAPLLYDVIFEATKLIPNPDPEEVAAGRLTMYDTWQKRRPDPDQPDLPLMQFIGSGSDYKGFQHNLGIPCMDVRYTHDNETIGEPLYHTLYETFALVDELYDRGFLFHKAVAGLWGQVAVTLADQQILPLDLTAYVNFISRAQEDLNNTYGDMIVGQNLSLEFFKAAGEKFAANVQEFEASLEFVDTSNPLAVRLVNDQIQMVERSFIDPRGLPNRPEYNHVVFAPSQSDAYSGTAFAGLTDTLAIIDNNPDAEDVSATWRLFEEHLAAVTFLLNTAGDVLSNRLW